jgi:hypothetical protein
MTSQAQVHHSLAMTSWNIFLFISSSLFSLTCISDVKFQKGENGIDNRKVQCASDYINGETMLLTHIFLVKHMTVCK